MNIEVGPESDKLMSYNEARLYCFCFTQDGKIGWRLPTREECDWIGETATIGNWYQDDPLKDDADEFWAATPVRDLKDD